MAQLAGITVTASVVTMAQFDSQNSPHQFMRKVPGAFWLTVGEPITPQAPVRWFSVLAGDHARVALIPYLTRVDDTASTVFVTQLGMVAMAQVPPKYAGRVKSIHISLGDAVELLQYNGQDCARQHVGIAVEIGGVP